MYCYIPELPTVFFWKYLVRNKLSSKYKNLRLFHFPELVIQVKTWTQVLKSKVLLINFSSFLFFFPLLPNHPHHSSVISWNFWEKGFWVSLSKPGSQLFFNQWSIAYTKVKVTPLSSEQDRRRKKSAKGCSQGSPMWWERTENKNSKSSNLPQKHSAKLPI